MIKRITTIKRIGLHSYYCSHNIQYSIRSTAIIITYTLLRSQLKDKFSDFLDKNRLVFVVLSGLLQRLERNFGVLF